MSELTIELLRLSLSTHQAVHKSHVSNIANSNNMAYKKQNVNFEKVLAELNSLPMSEKLNRTQQLLNHWSQLSTQYSETSEEPINLDDEVAKATLASGAYQKSIELLNRKLGLMQMAVKGGGGR